MMRFKVVPDSGEAFEVEAKARDVLAWEKRGKGRKFSDFREVTMAAMYELAYLAARRSGQWSGTLDEWCDLVDIEPVGDDDEEVDPTSEGR